MIKWILRFLGIGKPKNAPDYLAGKPTPRPKAKKTPPPKKAKKK